MSGGEITNNSATESGGGVSVDSGSFEMSGGTVSNNLAYLNGGGVFAFYDGSFVISGGTVSNNFAYLNGGGVWITDTNESLGSFKIPADAVGVVFSNNRASAAYDRNPADDDAYAMYIVGDVTWSDPLTQGYNNYDISYTIGTPLTFYTLSFDANAGDDAVIGLMSDIKLILFDKPIGKLPVLSRGGYVFEGWFTEAKGGKKVNPSAIVMTAEDHVLYAQWTVFVDTGGDSGKDSGSGFGQALITENNKNENNKNENNKNENNKNENNKNENNNSGSDKTTASPAKGPSGGDSKDTQNTDRDTDTDTDKMNSTLFLMFALLTVPALVFCFILYKKINRI